MLEDIFLGVLLIFLEIVLGVDNLVVLAMITSQVEKKYRSGVKSIGLIMAYVFRIIFVFLSAWLLSMKQTYPFQFIDLSYTDIFLLIGGLFLLYSSLKGLYDISRPSEGSSIKHSLTYFQGISLILFNDLVFSVDSVLTAVALTKNLIVINMAIGISMLAMYFLSDILIEMMEKMHRIKILGLLFVLLIGLYLVNEAFHIGLNKWSIIACLVFAGIYEYLCYMMEKKTQDVRPSKRPRQRR